MKSKNPNQLLADLFMELNSLEGKFLCKPVSLLKIYKFRETIKSLTTNISYNAINIYEILIFLNTALKIGLLNDIDKNYSDFTIFESSKSYAIVSGKITIEIPYVDRKLKVSYKPVVENKNGNIEMEWVVLDNKESRRYSITTEMLNNKISIDDRMSETKQLQFQSAKILSNAMVYYIKLIVRNLYNRYIHTEYRF